MARAGTAPARPLSSKRTSGKGSQRLAAGNRGEERELVAVGDRRLRAGHVLVDSGEDAPVFRKGVRPGGAALGEMGANGRDRRAWVCGVRACVELAEIELLRVAADRFAQAREIAQLDHRGRLRVMVATCPA